MIIMHDVPFCIIEFFCAFSDNYICMSKKNPSEMHFDRTIAGPFLAALLHRQGLERFMTLPSRENLTSIIAILFKLPGEEK